jgi:hypothetical protein
MNINNLKSFPDCLGNSADLLEDIRLFGAEEEISPSYSLLSSSAPSRKRKISHDFPNFSLDTIPRPSFPFPVHGEDLKNRKITLEKPSGFSTSSSSLSAAQEHPFIPTFISAAPPTISFSSSPFSTPSVFLVPQENPDPSKEPAVFHEPILSSAQKPVEDVRPPILDGSLELQEILEEAISRPEYKVATFKKHQHRLRLSQWTFLSRVRDLVEAKERRSQNSELNEPGVISSKDNDSGGISKGSTLLQKALEEAASHDKKNVYQIFRKHQDELPVGIRDFKNKVCKLKIKKASESLELKGSPAIRKNPSDRESAYSSVKDTDLVALERQAILEGDSCGLYNRNKNNLDVTLDTFLRRVRKRKVIEYPELIDKDNFPKSVYFTKDELDRISPELKELAIAETQKMKERNQKGRKKEKSGPRKAKSN